jgi:outer membrane protein OmpA-like peptidoglycan-associated protein/opacity protein-like surface antigen
VLPAGALAISADLTYPFTKTGMNVDYPEVDANVRFSPVKHLDFALTAYTFSDYALDVKYQVLGSTPDRSGLAVGVYDIGLSSYVSPIGHGTANAWPDWKWSDRPAERFSVFAVTSFPVTRSVRLHVGLGRGRFVGYSTANKFLNIDYFLDGHHQWAFGLFGGAEVNVTPRVALVAEASGRDMNAGVKALFGPLTATVAWTKLEGMFLAEGEPDGTAKFGRLEVGLSYQFNDLSGLSRLVPRAGPKRVSPSEPVPPPPEPILVPTGPAPRPAKFDLVPIYFDLDKSDIRPGDAEILKRNAEAIIARARAGQKADVIIEGHADPFASYPYNMVLGARRAESVRAYLVGLGVDAALLSTVSYGEEYPPYLTVPEYYLDRRCEFKWKE